jgi:hypothetical protein
VVAVLLPIVNTTVTGLVRPVKSSARGFKTPLQTAFVLFEAVRFSCDVPLLNPSSNE